MIKLQKLVSPSGLFDEIIFTPGLNIILGKYTKAGKDINGIGKSSIIDLIDLCLLADRPKKIFKQKKFDFLENHQVTLFIIIDGEEIQLEKRFGDINNVFVTIGDSFEMYKDSEYRLILGKRMIKDSDYSGISNPSWFRTIMNFFIQDDHSFHERNSSNIIKFIDGSHRKSELLTYLFFILGIDNSNIYEFDNTRIQLKQAQDDQTRIKKQVKENTGKDAKEIKSELDLITKKINEFEKQIDEFNFLDMNLEIDKDLESITDLISEELNQLNKMNFKLSNIGKSLQIDIDFDVQRLNKIYSVLNEDFAEYVKKSFDKIIDFRKTVVENRRRFLKEREFYYQKKIDTISQSIREKESKRSSILKSLEKQKAFDEIKIAYKFLAEKKAELEKNKIYIENIYSVEKNISTFKSKTNKIVDRMVQEKDSFDDSISRMKEIFYELIDNTVDIDPKDTTPYFQVEPRSHSTSPILINMEVPRSGSLGKDRFKILVFDLTIFIFLLEKKRALPSFLIHDGVFHSIAHKTRIKYLNYLNIILGSHEYAQYIFTLNEDEVSLPSGYSEELIHLDFDIEEKAIVVLEDTTDKMLFKKEF